VHFVSLLAARKELASNYGAALKSLGIVGSPLCRAG